MGNIMANEYIAPQLTEIELDFKSSILRSSNDDAYEGTTNEDYSYEKYEW